jgi:glycosyltransferase involved in cell wall biosynthesis
MNQPVPSGQSTTVRPRICYIATREPAYSRVAIVRRALHANFEVDEVMSSHRSYAFRFLTIALRVLGAWLSGRLRQADGVVVGFFAQPVFPLVRLLYRGPIIADAYFSVYDTLVHDKQKTREGSWLARTCLWLDQFMLHHADMCVTDTEQHVDYFRRRFAAPQADIRRLWISADCGPIAWNPGKTGESEPFDVFFWGGFIPLQGVETIIRAAALINEGGAKIRFTIFGTGQTLAGCTALSQTLKTSNVRFCGWQTADEIGRQAARSHVALGIFGTTEKAGRVIPNKAFEALAMGIPLITASGAASDELLVDRHTAILVEPGNPQALAEAIFWCRDHWQEVRTIAENGQALFQSTCSQQQINATVGEYVRDALIHSQSKARFSTRAELPRRFRVPPAPQRSH